MLERSIESERVVVRKADGESVEAQLVYFPDDGIRVISLELKVPGFDSIAVREYDLLECLLSVRRRLDQMGVKILCWGARRDVWPSGMQRDWSGGLMACRLGDRNQLDERSIFSPATADTVATVDEQRQFVENWYARRDRPAKRRKGTVAVLAKIRNVLRRDR
jgi:hypothetical protein